MLFDIKSQQIIYKKGLLKPNFELKPKKKTPTSPNGKSTKGSPTKSNLNLVLELSLALCLVALILVVFH